MIAIIGAGGHAKCVYECLVMQGHRVFGFFDDDRSKTGMELIDGVQVLGGPEEIYRQEAVSAVFVAIGDNSLRLIKYRKLFADGLYSMPNAVHQRAYISEYAAVGKGNFMMGAALINPGSRIGNCCIINTSATVGHDCVLEDGVQVGPGVNLAGGSKLKEGAFVGIGAKVAPEVTIGAWAVVGAGAVVLEDVPAKAFVCGVPAKITDNKK